MKTAFIVYKNYLTPDGSAMSIGGIQTYLYFLIPVLRKLGYDIHLYQQADRNFEVIKDGIAISGISFKGSREKFVKYLKPIVLGKVDKEKDLLLFGCETYSFGSNECKCIAIQHGIAWDKPSVKSNTKFDYLRTFIGKMRYAWNTIKRVNNVGTLVCVDYNFINWYRALTAYPLVDLKVIPNFTQVPASIPVKEEGKINIIFARRFFEYRGTRIFAEAIKGILQKKEDVSVTFAGEGPDENFLLNEFKMYSQVSFIKYLSKDSLTIHADKHIAVIPTLGSEGTSLSLLEAMASGCAVICTNVGGMTNIVIDHYNGLMISPNSKELYDALLKLIEDSHLRESLSKNAYDTVSKSFSLKRWEESWADVIRNM